MRKKIFALTIGILLLGSTALAAPANNSSPDSTTIEFGSTFNSRVKGTGFMSANVKGESGFKLALSTGLNDHWSFQYKYGQFKSEVASISGITTYAQDKLQDFNFKYKVNSNIDFVIGYEYDVISYGLAVAEASKSAMHYGIYANYPLNNKLTLFTNLLAGKDVSLQEYGLRYHFTPATAINLAYANRKINNVAVAIPALSITSEKENYTMTGITCVFSHKF